MYFLFYFKLQKESCKGYGSGVNFIQYKNPFVYEKCSELNCISSCVLLSAIRFGRIPQSEKQRLKAEQDVSGKEEHKCQQPDMRSLARQMHEAYLKHFHMNKAKARVFLTGKTSTPVRKSALND